MRYGNPLTSVPQLQGRSRKGEKVYLDAARVCLLLSFIAQAISWLLTSISSSPNSLLFMQKSLRSDIKNRRSLKIILKKLHSKFRGCRSLLPPASIDSAVSIARCRLGPLPRRSKFLKTQKLVEITAGKSSMQTRRRKWLRSTKQIAVPEK